jgi:hypothetical protein
MVCKASSELSVRSENCKCELLHVLVDGPGFTKWAAISQLVYDIFDQNAYCAEINWKQVLLSYIVDVDVGDLKKHCETVLGVVSQCCLTKHVYKMSKQYLANVALKINVKVLCLQDHSCHCFSAFGEEKFQVGGSVCLKVAATFYTRYLVSRDVLLEC